MRTVRLDRLEEMKEYLVQEEGASCLCRGWKRRKEIGE